MENGLERDKSGCRQKVNVITTEHHEVGWGPEPTCRILELMSCTKMANRVEVQVQQLPRGRESFF